MDKRKFMPSYYMNSLENLAFYTAVNNAEKYFDWKTAAILPRPIKSRFLKCFCNRNMIKDDNVGYLLDNSTTHFVLGGTVLSSEGLEKLSCCLRLEHLDLSEKDLYTMPIDDALNMLFLNLHHLTYVNLKHCRSLKSRTVVNLAKNCPNLKYLNVKGCRMVDDEALITLGDSCHFLEALELAYTQVTDIGVLHLAESKCNQYLKEFGISFCKKVSNDAVKVLLGKCQHINMLTFQDTLNISDDNLDEVCKNRGKLLKFTVEF